MVSTKASNKILDPKAEAMRLEEKARQAETFKGCKLKMRPGINPKYHYLNKKRPSQEDKLVGTVPERRGPAAIKPVSKKMLDAKVEAMRLEEKTRQTETVDKFLISYFAI
ncbi:hypothetical protein AAG570_006063 [Ranatra chinensis]|uniref:Uncharacterized protein n=1 Tax=Ranatra chinensis TaxID=642074 RepID=A0ABD0Y9U7_9HEMI